MSHADLRAHGHATDDTPPPILRPRVARDSTTTTWTAGNGNFNSAADWSNGVPTTGVDAYIDGTNTAPLTVTYSGGSDTANSLTTTYTTFDLSGGTLTLQFNSSLASAATALSQTGGKIDFQNGESLNQTSAITGTSGAVEQTAGTIQVDQGALDVQGNSSFAGTVTGVSGGGTLVLDARDQGATYSFTSSAHLTIGELVLAGGTTSIDSGATVSVTQIVIENNATLDVAGNLTYGGAFTDTSSGTNDFTLGGDTLTLTGSAVFGAFNGNAYIEGPGTLVLSGATTSESNYGNQVILADSADLVNSGVFTQNGNFTIGDQSGNLSAVTNSATGTWDIVAGTNLFVGTDASSSFTNAGLFENGGSNTGPTVETVFVNTGIVSAAADDSFYFDNQLTNTGTLGGLGQIAITGGTALLGTGTVLTSAAFGVYAGLVTLGTNLTYANSFVFSTGSGTIALGTHTLSLTGTVALGAIAGAADLTGSGTLALSGATTTTSNYGNTVDIGGTLDLVNTGTLTQTGNVAIGDGSGAQASVTNAAGAVWNSTAGAEIITGSNGASSFTNAGLFENTGSNTAPTLSATFDNAGTVSIAAGDGIVFDNTLTNTGTITGAGTLYLAGGTTTLNTGTVLDTGATTLAAGVLDLGTNITYAGTFTDSDTTSDALNAGKHTLRLNGAASFSAIGGSVDLFGAGLFELYGATTSISNYGNAVVVGGTETLENNSSFTQGGNVQVGDGSGGVAAVINEKKGTWDITTANNITVGSNASSSFTNDGLFENTGSGNSPVIDPVFDNTGTIDAVNAGTSISFEGGGSMGGTLSGAGDIVLGNGVFTIAAGVKLSVANLGLAGGQTDIGTSLTYAGSFAETGGTIDLTAAAAVLDLTGISVLAGTVSGSGTLEVGSSSTSSIDGLTLAGTVTFVDSGGVVSQGGQVTIGTNSSSTAQLETLAGSTYRITEDVGINSAGTGALANAGLFEKSVGTGTSVINALVTNTGTLEAASGTLDFAADVTNNATALATAGHTIEFGGSLSSTSGDTGIVQLSDGGLAQFGGYVGSSQTLSFLDGSTSEAFIAAPGQFDGDIKGFDGSNSLLLSGLTNVGDTYSGTTSAGTLTLTETISGDTVTVAQLHFTGNYTASSFDVVNNPGGVLITFAGAVPRDGHALVAHGFHG
jgi:hypothetical protein